MTISNCSKLKVVCSLIALAFPLLLSHSSASAQGYDPMMQQLQAQMDASNRALEESMANVRRNAEASLSQYINENREQLDAERQQVAPQMTVEQYARAKIENEAARRQNALNAQNGGSNPMFEQQKRMFEAGQKAHFDRQKTFDTQNQNWAQGQQQIEMNNQAWAQGQRQQESGHNRFIQQGIQGNQFYRNTETGQVAELPFAGDPGQYGNGNGDTWNSPQMGQFYQNGPNGMPQEMEAYEPPSYADQGWGE